MKHLLITIFLLSLGCSTIWASPCDFVLLPKPIQTSLSINYAGWKPLTPNLLESSDQQIWTEHYAKECPGLIKGRFTDAGEGYVLNLIKKANGQTFQQVVYFQQDENGYVPYVLVKAYKASVVSVLRLFAPGKYKDVINGNSLDISTDTIGLSEIGSGTVVYYWDGVKFRSIVTSQ